MNRRELLQKSSAAMAGLILTKMDVLADWKPQHPAGEFVSNRPSVSERTFISKAVEETIQKVKAQIADKEVAWMFENCYPNTLDTTVDYEIIDGKPDTFIITGDIDAMWLRDSTAQVWPYMPLIKTDSKLKDMVAGLVNRQVKCVNLDPYANAFYKDLSKVSDWNDDIPKPVPGVHERKWEVDSLCNVIRLSFRYYKLTGDISVFDDDWNKAMHTIVNTFKTEQRKDGTSPYRFIRRTNAMIDAPVFSGTGRPIKPTGMICSMFRPSDDATMYPFLVPSNIFAVISLQQLAIIYNEVLNDADFARECMELATEVNDAVQKYAVLEHLNFGEIYAYEVDGYGNRLFMDDANVPSLMSLAYIGAHNPEDNLYKNTRNFLLSGSNPYYLKGEVAEGQASPHTGKDRIWPMGIILRAMTSTDKKEISHCLHMLKATHAGTGFMHEAFLKDNPNDFYRAWFAWANTLFGELVIKVANEHPEILAEEF